MFDTFEELLEALAENDQPVKALFDEDGTVHILKDNALYVAYPEIQEEIINQINQYEEEVNDLQELLFKMLDVYLCLLGVFK